MPQMSPMMWMSISLSTLILMSMLKSTFQKKSLINKMKSTIVFKNTMWKW